MLKDFKLPFMVFGLVLSFSTSVYAQNVKISNIFENDKYFIKISKDSKNLVDPSQVDVLLSIDGKIITDVYPVIENGHTLVPLNLFKEKLNIPTSWDELSKKITFKLTDKEMVFKINSKTAYINNERIDMPIAPKIINSRTYIPVRFIAEILDYDVEYQTGQIPLDDEILNYYPDMNKEYIPVINLENKNKTNIDYRFKTVKGLNTYITKLIPFSSASTNDKGLFIYNNFPERIMSNSFLETYINQTNNVVGSARIFASHGNSSKTNIDYVIRIENTSPNDVELKYVYDEGIQKNPTDSVSIIEEHSQNFFTKVMNQEHEKIIIPVGEKKDFVMEDISDNRFFAAQLDMEVSDKVRITSFLLESGKQDLETVETPKIPYDFEYEPKTYNYNKEGSPIDKQYYTTYSGYSKSYSISLVGDFKASEMYLKNKDCAIGFETGSAEDNLNEIYGKNEILDIELFTPAGVNNEITKATWVLNVPYLGDEGRRERNRTRNYCNLGNWGIENNITINLENDTDEDKTFRFNLASPRNTVMLVEADNKVYSTIQDNSKFKSFFREVNKGYAVLDNSKEIDNWEVLDAFIPAGETKTITYKYVLGTDSSSAVYHIWEEVK